MMCVDPYRTCCLIDLLEMSSVLLSYISNGPYSSDDAASMPFENSIVQADEDVVHSIVCDPLSRDVARRGLHKVQAKDGCTWR